ncbi:MAG: SusF/SusE family outer membrane protein [Hymenobacter sp.]|nr:MAG: SusF/SusE family outer membrane protein [Hymenobacter sp.]
MNSRFTLFAAGSMALLGLTLVSCEKDDVKVTVQPTTAPTLAASTTSVVLRQATESQNAITFTWAPSTSFTWTNAEHPYNPALTYSFEVDRKGNNFASPVGFTAGAGPNTTLTVKQLATNLVGLGLTANTPTDLEVRLRASLGNQPSYSPVLPLSVSTYTFCPQPAKAWAVVGPAGPGWPGGGTSTTAKIDFVMQYDCDAKTFTYTGPLTADEFKFRYGYHWNTNLGGSGPTAPLSSGGANLKITTGGTYTVTLYNAADSTSLGSAYYTIK